MNNQTSLIKPFIRGLLGDVRDLFPENDFSYELDFLNDVLDFYEDQVIVVEFSKIGKAFEHAVITGEVLNLGLLPLLPFADGCNYPRFLQILWETVLLRSGHPYHASIDEQLYGRKDETCRAAQQERALACYLLRQFFCVFSKLSSMECLQRRS